MKMVVFPRMCAVAAAALAVFGLVAAEMSYDDLGALRPAGDSNDFWTTTDHAVQTLDEEATTSAVGIWGGTVVSSVSILGEVDARICVSDASGGENFNSRPVGSLFVFR